MQIERHPFEPFLPEGAVVLFLGSFPPQPKRWSMEFYYPNWLNDFWQEQMKKIENCIECRRCVSRCPYSLDTPNLLKKNYEDYKKVLAGEVTV